MNKNTADRGSPMDDIRGCEVETHRGLGTHGHGGLFHGTTTGVDTNFSNGNCPRLITMIYDHSIRI